MAELLLNAFSDPVLGDLSLETAFLRSAITDDFLNSPVDVLAWVEERSNGHCVIPGYFDLFSRRHGRSGNCRPRGRSQETSSVSSRYAPRGTGKRSAHETCLGADSQWHRYARTDGVP